MAAAEVVWNCVLGSVGRVSSAQCCRICSEALMSGSECESACRSAEGPFAGMNQALISENHSDRVLAGCFAKPWILNATSVRFRACSFFMMPRMWTFTVLSQRFNS